MDKKQYPEFTLAGRILAHDKKPAARLIVRAYDTTDTLLGDTLTDGKGRYRLVWEDKRLAGRHRRTRLKFYIRVYGENRLLEQSPTLSAVTPATYDLILAKPSVAPTAEATYTVGGRVRQSNQQPLAGIRVRAYDQGLRKARKLLGETRTDAEGRFFIDYTRADLLAPEEGRANLVVEATDDQGRLLAASPIRYNAGPSERFLLTLKEAAAPSEWEALAAMASRDLEEIGLRDLTPEDMVHLSKRHGIPRRQLQAARDADGLSGTTALPRWLHYGLLRQGGPVEMDRLLNTPGKKLSAMLHQAVAANQIAAVSQRALAAALAKLSALQVERVLADPLPGTGLPLAEVLAAARIPPGPQKQLALSLVGRERAGEEGLERLFSDVPLGKQAAARLGLTLKLVSLTDGDGSLVAALAGDGRIKRLRDLARHYDPDDWRGLVKSARRGGTDADGSAPAARRETAQRLYRRVAARHPTVAMAYGLARREDLRNDPGVTALRRIVDLDEGFDLAAAQLDAYVGQRAERFDLRTDAAVAGTVRALRRVQRLHRIKPDMPVVARLLADGLDSALAILDHGKATFMQDYGADDGFGKAKAGAIFAQAERNAAQAFGFFTRFSPAVNTTPLPAALTPCPAALKGVPDLATLFGSLNGCDCTPCESVYGDAAYLADLLGFVEQQVTSVAPELAVANGLEALAVRPFCDRNGQLHRRPRRPDIVQVQLSCRNADTELPYIDLVLEVLEAAVAPRTNNDGLQTHWSAVHLAGRAEHFHPAAYARLAEAVYPFELPFDLAQEETRAFLQSLGTSSVELETLFYPFVDPSQASAPAGGDPHDELDRRRWMDPRLARAGLQLSPGAWDTIAATATTNAQVAPAWGYAPTANWWHALRPAGNLLTRAGLAHVELLELLSLASINPGGKIGFSRDTAAACDPDEMTLEGLNTAALGFLHRFVRLQRALAWSAQDLDRALLDLSPPAGAGQRPSMDAAFLVRLSHLQRLQARFGLTPVRLLSWWADLDTRELPQPSSGHAAAAPCLYERLFLTGGPGDAAAEVFRLAADRSELMDAAQPLAAHTGAVAGALGLSQPALTRLMAALADGLVQAADGGPPLLNLANLSLLHRHASLAGALGQAMDDYLVLRGVIGFDPFSADPTSPGTGEATLQTLRFVRRAEALAASAFSLAEANYLLAQTLPFDAETLAPTAEWIAELGDSLRAALLGTTTEAPSPGAPPGATRQQQVDALATVLADRLEVTVPVARLLLTEVVSDIAPPRSALEILAGAPAAADTSPPAADTPTTSDGEDAEALGEVLYRLHKAALAIRRLGMADALLVADAAGEPVYLGLSREVGWLDPTALPIRAAASGPEAARARYDRWMRTCELFDLYHRLPAHGRPGFFDLFHIAADYQPGDAPFAEAQRLAYIRQLSALTGWPEAEVTVLVGRFEIGQISHGGGGLLRTAFPAHFTDERLPLRLMTLLKVLGRLGVSAAEAASWLSEPSGAATTGRAAEGLEGALKARHPDDWLTVLTSLRDPLRRRQRDALVAYLTHLWRLENEEALFDHFLLDVQMSPCMRTSRLIQATAAVQLFVQRVQMNLEPGLALSAEGADQWAWMKNYRVWEANRKVFLYPENWIEPDLRDDKTPFFRELENELMQSDMSNAAAETALVHYLEKLHTVARLQVCGQYLDKDANPITLHVFARTRDVPHRYFYRTGVLDIDLEALQEAHTHRHSMRAQDFFDAHWSAWQAVEVDVEGDHLIPMVYNRRVYLFWPVFASEDEAPLTRTFQELLTFYGQLFNLVLTTGKLIGSLATGLGLTIIGGLANSIIQMLYSLQNGFNDLIPGEGGPLNLLDQRNAIRDIRAALISALGVPASDSPSHDDTQKLIEYAGLTSFEDLAATFEDMLALLQRYEGYLLSFLPAKRLEVQLAWSEYKNDSWSAKKTSSGVVTFRDVISTLFESLPDMPGLARAGVKRLFTFRGAVDAHNQLFVRAQIALPTSLLDAATYTTDQWLSEPLEVGHFRYDVCSAQMTAVDTSEQIGIVDLLSQGVSQFLLEAGAAIDSLALGGDRQLRQRGVPVTPDDDPLRPSFLRHLLDEMPLPEHAVPPYQRPQDIDPYRILARHHAANDMAKLLGFFYQDTRRTFFCWPWPLPEKPPGAKHNLGFVFFPFYHPYACQLLESIQRGGMAAIYAQRYTVDDAGRLIPSDEDASALPLQQVLDNDAVMALPEYDRVGRVYNPANGPRELRPIEEFQFSTVGAYAQYNWEIFFHIPLLIATRLSTDQKFSEAQHWFHYIFDPTDASRGSAPEKYWRTRPFVATGPADYAHQDIDQLLLLLGDEAELPGLQEIERAVRRWRRNAFNPHLVARSRTVAFQKAVVMKYIDNLIAWGDSLFRRETRESVNEALQLYVLAGKLLGPRPRRIPRSAQRPEKSYADLRAGRDAFSNALVTFENLLPSGQSALGVGNDRLGWARRGISGPLDRQALKATGGAFRALLGSVSMHNLITSPEETEDLYFCVPPNRQLLDKWDLVADRLFKLRHCLNIEGQELTLGLRAAAIDPAILVRAEALGVDLDTLHAADEAAAPSYRFTTLVQKANELCGEVRALGAQLLAAMEKRDAEALVQLRNGHEAQLLEALVAMREKQLEEARTGLEVLQCSREAATLRRDHYGRLFREFMNPEEIVNAGLGALSLVLQIAQFGTTWGASAASLIPNIKGGFVTTLGGTYGGDNIKGSVENAAQAMGLLANMLSASGGLIATMGGYRRRAEDWQLQIALAEAEIKGLGKQIDAAGLRVEIAQGEVDNQKLQRQQNADIQSFMQSKFTSEALYDWMVAQTAALFFQSYQLAFDMARQAQAAFRFELGVEVPDIVQYGYWDNLKKGLLAGEGLQQDLKRLEVAFMAHHRRDFELTKHISLNTLDPIQLIRLRETGEADFSLPEALFDMDFPGHYLRRIKSVSVSIPCITGPYDAVSATLRLNKSRIRFTADLPGGIYAAQGDDDPRFRRRYSAHRVIATSSGQNDSGLFELNFRDERYLPFEGEGVESQWSLAINKPFAQFDLTTISDVVLHLRYTARDGGESLKAAALTALDSLEAALVNLDGQPQPVTRLFSLRHDFPSQWAAFMGQSPADGQRYRLAIELGEAHYPYWIRDRLEAVAAIGVLARRRPSAGTDDLPVYREADATQSHQLAILTMDGEMNDLLSGQFNAGDLPDGPRTALALHFDDNHFSDLWVAVTVAAPAGTG